MHRLQMVIESVLQLPAVFLAGGAMTGGCYAESCFARAGCAFGFNGDIAEPLSDAQEGLLHKD